MVKQLVLVMTMPSQWAAFLSPANHALCSLSKSEVTRKQNRSCCQGHLGHGQAFAKTAADPNREGVERGPRTLDAARAVVNQPPLGFVLKGVCVILDVVVDGVQRYGDVAT